MITFPTTRPQALLNAFNTAIADGDITTWEKDADGDFTHKASQWHNRGWLRPEVAAGTALRFTITFSKSEADKRAVYAYYHGKIAETFIKYFPNDFEPAVQLTPHPTGADAAT